VTFLLHLDSSANDSESVTRRLTAEFADSWRSAHGSAGYRYRDLAARPVPPLTAAYCTLGRRLEHRGLVPPSRVPEMIIAPAEELEWAATRPLIEELLAADTLLIGAPMYNRSVSAALKAWIDRVTFPGAYTDPDTGHSLLRDLRVVLVTARGGAFAADFQTPYLRAYFTELGVAHIHVVAARMTLAGLVPHLARYQPVAAESLATARAELLDLVPVDHAVRPRLEA
jgi:FMN-dependent NADH-azoreductase